MWVVQVILETYTLPEYLKQDHKGFETYFHSPSICLTLGASLSAGRGIEMATLCKSNISEASYSMFTYVSFPETEGQQLTDKGRDDSSNSWILHFTRGVSF